MNSLKTNTRKAAYLAKSDNKGAFVIPEICAQDIDTLKDWKLAEIKYKINFE